MKVVKSLPLEYQVVRFDGTAESIAEFAQSSYAIPGIENGMAKVWCWNARGYVLARVGDYVVRLNGSNDFQVLHPEAFAEMFGDFDAN